MQESCKLKPILGTLVTSERLKPEKGESTAQGEEPVFNAQCVEFLVTPNVRTSVQPDSVGGRSLTPSQNVLKVGCFAVQAEVDLKGNTRVLLRGQSGMS